VRAGLRDIEAAVSIATERRALRPHPEIARRRCASDIRQIELGAVDEVLFKRLLQLFGEPIAIEYRIHCAAWSGYHSRCSFPVIGRYSADINFLNVSKIKFAMWCRTRQPSHILNHWMIQPHGTMKLSIEAKMRQCQRD
jgi:hypothetical protein